jgi:DNA-binding NtrC family response regulator
MLRREIAEMKDLIGQGLQQSHSVSTTGEDYQPALEVLPPAQEGEIAHDEAQAIINPGLLGSLTAAQVEKELIEKSLQRFNFNKRKTARALQMAERTLYRKIKEYGIAKDT